LTTADFHQLAEVPPALSWFAKLDNPQTRRAYENDVREFMAFAGIQDPHAFRQVGRGHVLTWQRDLEGYTLGGATIRRKLSALSSLFNALCEANAVHGNPVDGVKRPKVARQEGSTPAISDHQARALLAAPEGMTLKACAIAPSWPHCCTTACTALSYVPCTWPTCRSGGVCGICA